jgi:hypothetical protein
VEKRKQGKNKGRCGRAEWMIQLTIVEENASALDKHFCRSSQSAEVPTQSESRYLKMYSFSVDIHWRVKKHRVWSAN